MTLIIGKEYRDKDGLSVTIGGRCKGHTEWSWSTSGDWYDDNGRFLTYQRNGVCTTLAESWRNLKLDNESEAML